jgi:hypothetical protein
MKLILFLAGLFFSCSTYKVMPKEQERNLRTDEKQKPLLPLLISFTKSVPDSIRDFVKVYMQTKGIKVITFEESIELIFEQKKGNFLDNPLTENESDKEYVDRLGKLNKPVYNLLRAEVFSNVTNNELLIDSVKWYVLQLVSTDTIKRYRSFYPLSEKKKTPYLIWNDFTDTVLISGLLK